MRQPTFVLNGLLLVCLAAVAAPAALAAEVTRQLRAEMPAGAAFAVENLAGSMRVATGSGPAVVVLATVHAESDALAALVRLEQVTGDEGRPTLRVRYPLDKHDSLRYPGSGGDNTPSWIAWLGVEGTRTEYDGHRVHVGGKSGVLLYADVEIQIPRSGSDGLFTNHVGKLAGKDLEGTLKFETGSGDVRLESVKGSLRVDTGSGDLHFTDGSGTLRCDTGSGDALIERFNGERFEGNVGSGDITVRSSAVRKVEVDVGSGDVRLKGIDAEEVSADSGSGDLLIEIAGTRLRRIDTDTGSGDVVLRLGAAASFDARASQGSGDLINRYDDAQPIAKGREVIGYRRGDARTEIRVDTGSGDLIIEPGNGNAT